MLSSRALLICPKKLFSFQFRLFHENNEAVRLLPDNLISGFFSPPKKSQPIPPKSRQRLDPILPLVYPDSLISGYKHTLSTLVKPTAP